MNVHLPRAKKRRGVAGRAALAGVGLVLLALGWRVTGQDQAVSSTRSTPPAVATPVAPPLRFTLRVAPGEGLAAAARRVGVNPADAAAAERLMTLDVRGAALDAAISDAPSGRARLISLSLHTGPVTSLSLSRAFDGALHLTSQREDTEADTGIAVGRLNGSLYASALRAGANDDVIAGATRLLSHRFDLQRDLHNGDAFRLVFDRVVTEAGRTVQTGRIRYAEIVSGDVTTRLYAFDHDGQVEYFDQHGLAAGGLLLRTPVDGARITSGFGLRFHPVLGYTRMHQGIDFGAPIGTPVYAAGDGEVLEAGRAGGYGNMLRIHHASGWDTAYGHLLRYAPGIAPGVTVRQGQIVAYVGSSGLSTGPHLHYEVLLNGERINPLGAQVPQGLQLAGGELQRFIVQRNRIDVMVAAAVRRTTGVEMASRMTDPSVLGLRPALNADAAYAGRAG